MGRSTELAKMMGFTVKTDVNTSWDQPNEKTENKIKLRPKYVATNVTNRNMNLVPKISKNIHLQPSSTIKPCGFDGQ